MQNEETIKMLKGALNLELWAITIYEDMIKRTGNKDVRKTISKIIDNGEVQHMKVMREEIHKLMLKEPAKERLTKERLKGLLMQTLKEEIGMQKFYKGHIGKIKDPGLKIRLKKIYNDEVEHEKMIRKLIASL